MPALVVDRRALRRELLLVAQALTWARRRLAPDYPHHMGEAEIQAQILADEQLRIAIADDGLDEGSGMALVIH